MVKHGMAKHGEFSFDQLSEYMTNLCKQVDTNGDGILQPEELKRLLAVCGLNLSARTVLAIMDTVDVNKDGVILYEKFVPAFVSLIKDRETDNATLPTDTKDIAPDMMDRYLRKLFKVSDKNGDGVLQPDELEALLSLSGFNFSAREVQDVIREADLNSDGVIEYDEFVPIALKFLINREVAATTSVGQPAASVDTTFTRVNDSIMCEPIQYTIRLIHSHPFTDAATVMEGGIILSCEII